MHTTISYANSPSPAFDAVEDIKAWFGPKWTEINAEMSKVASVQSFAFYAEFAGVQGFPVKAWYDMIHGEGSWDKAWAEIEPPTPMD